MPIDRFDEVSLKLQRGEVITVTGYYGLRGLSSGVKYPLRMDFEVVRWPMGSSNLRCFAYSFTSQWLEKILLPLQSSEIRWYKMTLHLANGKTYQIPLVGKYGKFEGPQNPGRMFEVSLIPHLGSKATKTFRIRGVAEAYDQFDRPDLKAPEILRQAQLLERALVTPMIFSTADHVEDDSAAMVLQYVRIPEAERKARQRAAREGRTYPFLGCILHGIPLIGRPGRGD